MVTGTREPARSSSATASMFPGMNGPAWRYSIPANGATVTSARDPCRFTIGAGGYSRAESDAITPTERITTALPPLTSRSESHRSQSLQTRPTLPLCHCGGSRRSLPHTLTAECAFPAQACAPSGLGDAIKNHDHTPIV